jgi:SAM-dependent methyltransferase
MTKLQRTHDLLYLSENRYQDPKQLHKEIVTLIKSINQGIDAWKVDKILDVGCAAGEFAYLLRKEFGEAEIEGFDLLQPLVDKARKNVVGVQFSEADILDPDAASKNFFNVITCTGVISIFDEFQKPLNNMINWAAPGGFIFLHSLFSDYPIDVRIQYNHSRDYGSGIMEMGWNIFSKESVSVYLNELLQEDLIESYKFHDFQILRELEKQEDLVRSWTFRDENGDLKITNGLNILQPHKILVIKKAQS